METENTISPEFHFPDADLIIRTVDNMTFHVHKFILSFASRVFRDMLSLDNLQRPSHPHQRVVDVSETSMIWDAALRYLYPLPRPTFKNLGPIALLFAISDKYDIPIIASALEDTILISNLSKRYPIRSFALAKKFNRARLLTRAETELVKQHCEIIRTTTVPEELDYITVDDVRRLEFYRTERLSRIRKYLTTTKLLPTPECNCWERYKRTVPKRCEAWECFVDACWEELRESPTSDISDLRLRRRAVEESECPDAQEVLFRHYDLDIGTLEYEVSRYAWLYPEKWAESKATIAATNEEEREDIEFEYTE
ncbi:hypothetical protein SISNIDRAFT_552948 [Sistotremastrum niveocremeum HHB9708]|uniref:BTB domain-containing protein n=1 Tax=Sistotremastrum niveocremeum HHB9708 TaxID=1314777 RepID=A0A164NMW6_9AGAM|nr:hypothetical protein SISNIDRAFT_552948 [Sistotremastrum niveocremeum HHB9708]